MECFSIYWIRWKGMNMTLLSSFLLLVTFSATLALDSSTSPDLQLLAACMAPEDSVDAVKIALIAGADINAIDHGSGQTPIMAATLRGNPAIVKYLLHEKADLTIGERDGYTPAHGAGFQGRAGIMKLLNEHGVDVLGDMHTDGYYPFHRACWGAHERHTETVRYLLTVGVDVNLVGKSRKTCMEMTRNLETKKVLREYGATESEQEL
jgi:ankyrin repeat protein